MNIGRSIKKKFAILCHVTKFRDYILYNSFKANLA